MERGRRKEDEEDEEEKKKVTSLLKLIFTTECVFHAHLFKETMTSLSGLSILFHVPLTVRQR